MKWTLTTHTYLKSCSDQNQFCHKTAENRIYRRTQPPTPTGMCLCFGRFCTVGGLKNIWGEAKYPQKIRYHKNNFQNIPKNTILNRHRISQKVRYSRDTEYPKKYNIKQTQNIPKSTIFNRHFSNMRHRKISLCNMSHWEFPQTSSEDAVWLQIKIFLGVWFSFLK